VPLRVEHAGEMTAALADPGLYEHIGGAPPTPAELEERYARWERGHSPDDAQGWLNWIVRKRSAGEAVGVAELTATIAPANSASETVAARLGMVATGERVAGEVRWVRDLRLG
jgi:hypothetical protein